jgi:uncharacterized protein (TIGR02001 family)
MHFTATGTIGRTGTGVLLIGALTFASTAHAELSFHVGVFSDYLDYGASASNNNAVVQGGIDYSHDSGFYSGTALSTLDDGDGQEVELYAGYGFSVGEFDIDVGYVYSYYPSLDDEDLGEIYGQVGWGRSMSASITPSTPMTTAATPVTSPTAWAPNTKSSRRSV